MVSKMYECCEDDIILIMGDLNGRIGEKNDYILGVDDIPPRTSIDTGLNDHGRALLNFLIQSKMCVLNGRLCPLDDTFTSISHRGRAVVDYMITQHDQLKYFSNFTVRPVNDVVVDLNLVEGSFTRISDHSILQVQLDTSHIHDTDEISQLDTSSAQHTPHVSNVERSEMGKKYNKPPTKYKKGVLPEEFMTGNDVLSKCSDLIDAIIESRGIQEEVDIVYDQFVKVYHEEISNFLKVAKVATKSRKSLRHVKKPYWNEHLSVLWQSFHEAELKYLKTNVKDGIPELKSRLYSKAENVR